MRETHVVLVLPNAVCDYGFFLGVEEQGFLKKLIKKILGLPTDANVAYRLANFVFFST
jgi:hypothetical protein